MDKMPRLQPGPVACAWSALGGGGTQCAHRRSSIRVCD